MEAAVVARPGITGLRSRDPLAALDLDLTPGLYLDPWLRLPLNLVEHETNVFVHEITRYR